MTEDIRWKQRFHNYTNALQTLIRAKSCISSNLKTIKRIGVFLRAQVLAKSL